MWAKITRNKSAVIDADVILTHEIELKSLIKNGRNINAPYIICHPVISMALKSGATFLTVTIYPAAARTAIKTKIFPVSVAASPVLLPLSNNVRSNYSCYCRRIIPIQFLGPIFSLRKRAAERATAAGTAPIIIDALDADVL